MQYELTTAEVSALTGISMIALAYRRTRRQPPEFIKYGDGRVRYLATTIQEYLQTLPQIELVDGDELLTESQASALLKVTNGRLAKWRFQGKGPVYAKIEKFIRYRLSDLKAFAPGLKVKGRRPLQGVPFVEQRIKKS